MSIIEAFLLGIMAAWTPALVLLAWMLRHGFGSRDQHRDVRR